MTHRIAVTFSALSLLLGASQASFGQGQPDPCADSFFAWQYTRCASPQAIEGRRARGIPEPAHPEDPMTTRARRDEGAPTRAGDQPQQLRPLRASRTSSQDEQPGKAN